jgi:hypothetical protein
VGTWAVVFGVLGVLVAWIPVWTFGVLLFGPSAVGLGLVGVLRRGLTARRCWVGLVLGVMSIAMFFNWSLVWR